MLPHKTEEAHMYYAKDAMERNYGVRELRCQISRKAYERRENANMELSVVVKTFRYFAGNPVGEMKLVDANVAFTSGKFVTGRYQCLAFETKQTYIYAGKAGCSHNQRLVIPQIFQPNVSTSSMVRKCLLSKSDACVIITKCNFGEEE
jgi:hypothetical protein